MHPLVMLDWSAALEKFWQYDAAVDSHGGIGIV